MSRNYDDIIHLPHHVSKRRKPMSMIDRAAQFSPFAALTGYDSAIQETGRLTDQWIDLAVDEKVSLNRKFQHLANFVAEQPEVTVTCFVPDERKSGGSYVRMTGRVKKIDTYEQAIVLEGGIIIPFNRIYAIDGAVFDEIQTLLFE